MTNRMKSLLLVATLVVSSTLGAVAQQAPTVPAHTPFQMAPPPLQMRPAGGHEQRTPNGQTTPLAPVTDPTGAATSPAAPNGTAQQPDAQGAQPPATQPAPATTPDATQAPTPPADGNAGDGQEQAPDTAAPAPTPDQLETVYGFVWMQIARTFTNEQAIRSNWMSWRDRYKGKLTTLEELDAALQAMVGSLGDDWTKYTSFRDMLEMHRQQVVDGIFSLGVHVKRQSDGTYTVDNITWASPAYGTNLREGMQVKSVNGTDLRNMPVADAERLLRAHAGDVVKVVVVHNGQEMEVELTAEPTPPGMVMVGLLEGNIAYVRLPDFVREQHIAMMVAGLGQAYIQTQGNLQGVVLDLRNNPGGVFDHALVVASIFMERGVIVKARTRDDRIVKSTSYEVLPYMPYALESMTPVQRDMARALQTLPLAVLVNGSSASASEIVTGALKDNNRARVFGTTTFGKGTGYSQGMLPNGAQLSVKDLTYLTPSDYDLNGRGIEPHVKVEMPLGAETDVQLQAAHEYLVGLVRAKEQQLRDAQTLSVAGPEREADHTRLYVAAGVGGGVLVLVVVALVLVRRKRAKNKAAEDDSQQ